MVVELCCGAIILVLVVVALVFFLRELSPPTVQKVYVKKCLRCGKDNGADATFCSSCGAAL
jgi:hypothetical protein